jgi:hypothetical protein
VINYGKPTTMHILELQSSEFSNDWMRKGFPHIPI